MQEPRNGDHIVLPEYDDMGEDERRRRMYDAVMELHQAMPKVQGEVMRLGGEIIQLKTAVRIHEDKDETRHREVMDKFSRSASRLRDVREKVDSVSSEVEDTKTRDLRELRRRAELPKKVGIWALKIAGGVCVIALAHWLLTTIESAVKKSAPPAPPAVTAPASE